MKLQAGIQRVKFGISHLLELSWGEGPLGPFSVRVLLEVSGAGRGGDSLRLAVNWAGGAWRWSYRVCELIRVRRDSLRLSIGGSWARALGHLEDSCCVTANEVLGVVGRWVYGHEVVVLK